jgi:DegV family protein with EDD domain
MTKIAIVTDSTTYLPAKTQAGLSIFTIPLHVIWGNETYKDNVDITSDEFYEKLGAAKIMPSTSQPSPQEFVQLYKKVLEEFDEILSIHISAKLSGTVDSAVQAKKILENKATIEVVDSCSTSMGLGFLALAAARMAKSGENLQAIRKYTENAKDRVKIFFILRTLEFLRRGGRIGSASALLGTALNLKPILMVDDGEVKPYIKVRTMQKALTKLAEILDENIQGKTPVHLSIIQAGAEDDAKFLQNEINNRVKKEWISEMTTAGISPVIGTHAGPGAVGICFLTEK